MSSHPPRFESSSFRVTDETKKIMVRVMHFPDRPAPSVEIWNPHPACAGDASDMPVRYDYFVSNPNQFDTEEEAFAAFLAAEIFVGSLPIADSAKEIG